MDGIVNATKGRGRQRAIGIDLGLKSLMTLSNGVHVGHHESLPRLKHNLKYWIRKLEGQRSGSKRWYETLRIIDKTRQEIENCQQDYANKLAHVLTRHYKIICIEGPINGGTISQEVENEIFIANWDVLRRAIKRKCQETGVMYIEVSPYFTTQTCSRCGCRQKMALGDRLYHCKTCGLSIDRDTNAALNIRRKGLEKLEKQRKVQEKFGSAPF